MIGPKNYALLTAQSMGASFNSASIPLSYYYGCSLQAVWTGGSAAGTLSIAYSNDNVTFSVDGSSTQTAAGAGDYFWDLTQTSAAYVRLQFTRTGGTGSLSAQVNGKTVS